MLDEVIDYLKQLQAQVQVMSRMSSMMTPMAMPQLQMSAVMVQMAQMAQMAQGMMSMGSLAPPAAAYAGLMPRFVPAMPWDPTTTSGAGVSHLCCCRRRVLLVCKCRTGMEPPLYDGLAVLCYELLGAVETLFLDGTLGLLLYSQPTSTSPVQLVLSFFPSLRLVGRNLGKSPIYEEVLFNFY